MGASMSTPGQYQPASQHADSDKINEHHANIHSRQSSISSESSGTSASSAEKALANHPAVVKQEPTPDFTASLKPAPVPTSQLDPLSREYPKPTEEINVSEMLNRKPHKWSLGYYINETPIRSPSPSPSRKDPELAAREMEKSKRELLEAREEIGRLSIPK